MRSRQSVQSFLGNLYDRFNRNRRVFPRPPSNNVPMRRGIASVPFDAGMESDNMRRGGMSTYEIASMLGREMLPPTGSGRGISSVRQGPSMNFIPRAEAATTLSPAPAGPAEMGGMGRRFFVDQNISDQSYGMAQDPFAGGMPRQPMPMDQEMDIGDSGGRLPRRGPPMAEVRPVTSATGTRPPDAIGRMAPPLPRPNPRRIEEEQRDPGTDAELDAGIDQAVDTEKDESFKFDPDMDLVRLGLEISAAASKPGATFLGSLAQGGLNHLNRKEKRELIQEDRAYKQSIMKMEQNFTASQNQLNRAQELGIAQDRIKVLENQNEIRSKSLAETIRKNTEMLNIEYKKLPTDKQKDAEGRLLEQKIKVQETTANYYDAKARGEGDALKIQEETTKREYIRAALELIDIDKIDVIGKTEAEKTQIYQAEVKRALSGLQVLSSALDKFLPGVTRGVISSIEGGGGGGGGNTRLKFNPETGAIE